MSLADTDPDMELVRKLHLELNGSGRRTRGGGPPPSKRFKRDTSRGLSEGPKDTPSASRSGSGSGSARLLRREGALRRLVKKQPESDSNQHNGLEDDGTTMDAAMHDSLEPQASTKALEERQRGALLQGDVGSRMNADFTDPDAIRMAAAHAAKLACNAAARDASLPSARVKCFYQGYSYGLSLDAKVLASRASLANALRSALATEDIPVCPAEELEIMALDSMGKQNMCKPDEGDNCWHAAVKAAKRVYIKSSASLPVV